MWSKIARLARTAIDTAHCWGELRYWESLARKRARAKLPVSNDVLMIAWQFPPIMTGGVYRPLSFAKYFSSVGQPLTVVCSEPSSNPLAAGMHLARQVPEAVRVSRVHVTRKRMPGYRYFPRVDGGMTSALDIVSHALRTYVDVRPRVILASGPPFHSVVAAHLLSEIWDVPLVVDYRDEWTQNPMAFVETSDDDFQWEARLNRRASRIVLVSETQRDQHLRAFQLPDTACSVVTNGWEPDDQDIRGAALPAGSPRDNAIHMSFTGLLGAHTAPDEFLRTLHLMLEHLPTVNGRPLTLQFVGVQATHCAAVLEQHTTAYPGEVGILSFGPLPKAEAVAITHASDIVFLINPPHLARYIPGKLYEYVAAGRPILVYGAGGEIERVINETMAGIVVAANDPAALRAAIERLMQQKNWMGAPRRDWLARHRRDVQAKEMLRILNEVA